jgi:CHAT domain-containing protein
VLQLARQRSTPVDPTTLANSPLTQAPTLAEIQQIARDTNSTLVTYSQIFDQALYIWIVQPSGEIAFRSVEFEGSGDAGLAINPIADIDGPVYRSAPDESELGQLVANSRASIVIESTNTRPEQLRELYTLLIAPITHLLPTDPKAKVVFLPQGNLFLVPFAALQDADGTYLIEKHTILTAPSIQVYGLANEAASATAGANGRSPFSAANALIVGNPTMPKVWSPNVSGDFAETQLTDLPGAKAEAEAIGGFLNITPLIGPQATEAQVKQLLPSARLIHLATHGLLDYGDPRAYGRLDVPGAIALTPDSTEDGLLTSAEILEMDLQAELAVLSACDTGRGRITGDGVVGLSRALITAGVPSVVVSLWAVPDAPTAELMTEFYRQLDQGQDKAQALRQAMLNTMQQHPSPRNWAAFTLIGAAE